MSFLRTPIHQALEWSLPTPIDPLFRLVFPSAHVWSSGSLLSSLSALLSPLPPFVFSSLFYRFLLFCPWSSSRLLHFLVRAPSPFALSWQAPFVIFPYLGSWSGSCLSKGQSVLWSLLVQRMLSPVPLFLVVRICSYLLVCPPAFVFPSLDSCNGSLLLLLWFPPHPSFLLRLSLFPLVPPTFSQRDIFFNSRLISLHLASAAPNTNASGWMSHLLLPCNTSPLPSLLLRIFPESS